MTAWRRWCLELALRSYPAAFRRRFGDEIRQDVRDRLTGRLWLRLVLSGLAERQAAISRLLTWSADRPHLYRPSTHERIWMDLRYAIRGFQRKRAFTSVSLLVLALGIGVNIAVFSVLHAVLLRPLPYSGPERLVAIWSMSPEEAPDLRPLAPGDFEDIRAATRAFAGLGYALSFLNPMLIEGQEDAGPVQLLRVSPGLLELLGRPAAAGRIFGADDRDVAVISDRLWRTRFGGDPRTIGRLVTLSGREPLEVVGVMPPDFALPFGAMLGPGDALTHAAADLWAPMPMEGSRWRTAGGTLVRNVQMLAAFGRLGDGISVEQAEEDVRGIASALEQAHPGSNRGRTAVVVPLTEQAVGDMRPILLVLMTAVTVLLLMAAVNVTNLVLARSISRRGEFGVRAALGATRGALFRQVLTEGFVLAAAGGVLGLLAGGLAVRTFLSWAPAELQQIALPRLDGLVIAFVALLVLVTGVVIAIVPALVAARGASGGMLDQPARGSPTSRTGARLRAALVVVEVGLAVLLIACAGLLVRSFQALLAVDPGFRPEHTLSFQLNVPDRLGTPGERFAFYERLFDRLESIPGVVAAGGVTRIPLGSPNVSTQVEVEGRPLPEGRWLEVEFRRAMHQYFTAMGIPVIRGRTFTRADATGPGLAVINETMARRLFGVEEAVGRRLRLQPAAGEWLIIIGVVGDVRHGGLDQPVAPELYVDYSRNPPVAPFVVLRTSVAPRSLVEVVRREVRAVDAAAAPYGIRTLEEIRAQSVAERRFSSLLMTGFGLTALLLAAAGVYGVAALVATERTREIGVRLALGASPAAVVGLIVRQASLLAAAGAVAGTLAAAAAAPLTASQLFGVGVHDPVTFSIVPVLLVAVAALASVGPAIRAARVDPLLALRSE